MFFKLDAESVKNGLDLALGNVQPFGDIGNAVEIKVAPDEYDALFLSDRSEKAVESIFEQAFIEVAVDGKCRGDAGLHFARKLSN